MTGQPDEEIWLTGAELAEHYRVRPSTVSRWRGRIESWPEAKTVTRHGRALDAYPLSVVAALLDEANLPHRGFQDAMLTNARKKYSPPAQEG